MTALKPKPSSQGAWVNGRQPWATVPLFGDGGPLLAALRQGLVEPQDFAVLEGLRQHLEWRAERIWASLQDLSEMTGLPEPLVVESIAHLMAAGLLVYNRHPTHPVGYFVMSPALQTNGQGGAHSARFRHAQWVEALASDLKPGDRISGTRPRRLRELARERAAKAEAALLTDDTTATSSRPHALPRLRLAPSAKQRAAERQRMAAADQKRQQQRAQQAAAA